MNTYNARLSFKGEGSFEFTLPNYGEVQIVAGKDIFIKGLNQDGVEALRSLRPLLLEHKLNAKPDGCFKVIEIEGTPDLVSKMAYNYKPVRQVAPAAELKAELTNAPISEEELKEALKTVEEPKVEEPKVEEPKVEEPKVEVKLPENLGEYILTSTKHKGKKLSQLSSMQISGNMSKFNAEDLIVVEAYKNNK